MRGTIARLRPVLSGRLACWLHQEERRWSAAMAEQLVEDMTPGRETGWRTTEVTFTGTSVAIATVVRSGSPRRYVVKVPWTNAGIEGLRRQAAVLAVLEQESRLSALRQLLPRCLDQGEVDGRYYSVEEALPGVCANGLLLRRACRPVLLNAATTVISDLHASTREQTVLDRSAVHGWVDVPLGRIEESMRARPQAALLVDAVGRLREELVADLLGRPVHVSWIHGDFWPGNLLAAAPTGPVTGVVDWDCAGSGQLPLHDLLHLHMLTHRVTSGAELGNIVVSALHRGIDHVLAVPSGEVAAWLDTIPPRVALLLYWLRHVLLFIDSEGDHEKPRWLRENVERVLVNV